MAFPGKKVIMFSVQPQDIEIGSNSVNLSIEFQRDNEILYINNPLDINSLLFDRSRSSKNRRKTLFFRAPELVKATDKMWVLNPRTVLLSINRLPHGWLYMQLLKFNNWLFAQRVKKAAKKIGFTDFSIFNDCDMFRSLYMKDYLKPNVYCYYFRDNFISVPYWKRHLGPIEIELARKADVCFANSMYLHEKLLKSNPNSYMVGQGVDLSLWEPDREYPLPADLPIDKPIVGYIGALVSLRLDIELLEFCATQLPQYNFLLIGIQDDDFRNSKLHQMENVIFMDNMAQDMLPAYVSRFAVCINPQLINEMTIGNYPRKLDEYLAMGKPVVATMTGGSRLFESHVYLVETKEEYRDKLIEAVEEDGSMRDERIAFARSHNWDNSISKMYNAINKTYEQKMAGKV